MHLFRDVYATQIDDDGMMIIRHGDTKMLVGHRLERCNQRIGLEPNIDEPGTGDGRRLGDLGHIKRVDKLLGQITWRRSSLLSQTHGRIDLKITEVGIS